ncbi:MAG: hypothetical protein GY925_13005, partial [Actinomycetia bacterium]|nr:hypothetical protein [Actinomycetes bacterium]
AEDDQVKVADISMHLLEAIENAEAGDRHIETPTELIYDTPAEGEVATLASPVVEEVQAPEAEVAPDDLKRIKGIGPVLEAWLHTKDILTFEQIAALSQDEIDALEEEQSFPDRIDREDWKGQAAALAEEKNQG